MQRVEKNSQLLKQLNQLTKDQNIQLLYEILYSDFNHLDRYEITNLLEKFQRERKQNFFKKLKDKIKRKFVYWLQEFFYDHTNFFLIDMSKVEYVYQEKNYSDAQSIYYTLENTLLDQLEEDF